LYFGRGGVGTPFDFDGILGVSKSDENKWGDWDGPAKFASSAQGHSPGTQWLRSRKVCSALRADFGVFGHLIPAVANERSYRHASANDDKRNANDCTDYSPAK